MKKASAYHHAISKLIERAIHLDDSIEFTQTMAVIDQNYQFTETRFINGDTINDIGYNNGSCKIFSFAKLHGLDARATLELFGDYYRVDVLQDPNNSNHANIRSFIDHGWQGIHFDNDALTPL